MGYLSTTGVYGNQDGRWVDEDTPPAVGPDRRLRARLDAEGEWLDLARLVPRARVFVFRLAGIYGPGRSALDTARRRLAAPEEVAALRPGRGECQDGPGGQISGDDARSEARTGDAGLETVPLPSQIEGDSEAVPWVSRVHVADICGILLASAAQQSRVGAVVDAQSGTGQLPGEQGNFGEGRIYNVADEVPSPRAQVMALVAELLGSPGQPRKFTDPGVQQQSPRRGRAERDRKRVDVGRVRKDLGYELRYPSFEQGLRAIHGQEEERAGRATES